MRYGDVMKIKSITKAGVEPVYNMTVDEHHNYMIHGGVILKNCDALRYYAVTRTLGAEMAPAMAEDEDDEGMDYDASMTGGEMTENYLMFGD